jgi:hypothetical protein
LDQKQALAVAAGESGRPVDLLEKDIWVVLAQQIVGTDQEFLQSLTFKGETSLSKTHPSGEGRGDPCLLPERLLEQRRGRPLVTALV